MTADQSRRRSRRPFYAQLLTEGEIRDMRALLAASPTIDEEIALLRVIIRRLAEGGATTAEIVRAIDALGRALRVRNELSGDGLRDLKQAAETALDDVARDLGMEP